MVGFGAGCFDRDEASSILPIRSLISDVYVRNTGNRGFTTEMRGSYEGKELIATINRYMVPSRDEIMMGVRNNTRIGNFENTSILKLTINDVDVRDMSIEDFNRRFKNCS